MLVISSASTGGHAVVAVRGVVMPDVAFVLVILGGFALLALIAKGVEKL